MKTQLILIFLVSFIGTNAQQLSPQVIASTGGIVSQINAQLSYTVGEPVINTGDDGTTVLSQGYQQPHSEITQLSEFGIEEPEISVYPNPTTDWVNLSFQNAEQTSVRIIVLDELGKEVMNMEHDIQPYSNLMLEFVDHAAGIYYLQVHFNDGSRSQNFEIIKQ